MLTKDNIKIISRWTRRGYCVYIRPFSSKLIDPKKEHELLWVVSVEYVNAIGQVVQIRDQDWDLHNVVTRVDARVPQRPQNKKRRRGWLAPERSS